MTRNIRIAAVVAAAFSLAGMAATVSAAPALAAAGSQTASTVVAAAQWRHGNAGNEHAGNEQAGNHDGNQNGTTDGNRNGTMQGTQNGAQNGTRNDGGDCDCADAPKGTLTDAQRSTLQHMAQDEKLAHDVYVALADKYDDSRFDRIAKAETQHLTAVRTMLDRYGLTDPTAGMTAGKFSDPAMQATYDRLVAQGSADLPAALQVGQQVEKLDIDDLKSALDGLTAPDVTQVYQRLLKASEQHLTAFSR